MRKGRGEGAIRPEGTDDPGKFVIRPRLHNRLIDVFASVPGRSAIRSFRFQIICKRKDFAGIGGVYNWLCTQQIM